MKISMLTLLALVSFVTGTAQAPELGFRPDGKFKIVQFTDLHYVHGNPKCEGVLENLNNTIKAEKPDLIVLTGDIIFGRPGEESMRDVMREVSSHGIPFAVTFGNHDHEYGLTNEELLTIVRGYPNNVTDSAPGISGVTNFILPVRSSAGPEPARIIYVFDSHAYSRIEGVKGYDHVKADQIAWYCANSRGYAQRNGGVPVPSLAFLHIPFPEFGQAAADETAALTGTRREKVSSPLLNSGLFAAMREMGDVKGVFVGHDHDNDYAVYWHDILLAFGRYGGGATVYNNLGLRGARVIEMTEGSDSFRTWIHLADRSILYNIEVPGFALKKKN